MGRSAEASAPLADHAFAMITDLPVCSIKIL